MTPKQRKTMQTLRDAYSDIGGWAKDSDLLDEVDAVLRADEQQTVAQDEREAPSVDAAYEMGAKGGPVSEAERLAFEAWMRGHCWALCAEWTGSQYLGSSEQGGDVDPRAMMTRRLWAAWRDRAALSASLRASPTVPVAQDEREPFWFAVVSKTAPVINKAIRREDVANEYAAKFRDEGYPDVEVVPLFRAALSASTQPAAVPPDVLAALDRMCTPLDESWLKGATAEADAHCMKLIRDYVSGAAQPAVSAEARAALRAWDDLPESLKAHPGVKALYRGLLDTRQALLSVRIDAAMGTPPAPLRPPMRHIAGVSEGVLRRAATPPADNKENGNG